MTPRRNLHLVACLLLLTAIMFLAVKYVQARRSHAELQEKLYTSQQESDRIKSELTLLQEKLDNMQAAQELAKPDQKGELQRQISVLEQQMEEKDEAYSALQTQVQSTQRDLDQARKTQSEALAKSETTQKQGEGIVSAIEKAARQQREAEEMSRKMREEFWKPLSTVRKRAEEATDPEERERLFRVADIIDRSQELLNATSVPPNEEQRKEREQERDELGREFKVLAREHIQSELEHIRVRFGVPPEQADEFFRAALRVISGPEGGGRSSLLSVRMEIFSPPENAPPTSP